VDIKKIIRLGIPIILIVFIAFFYRIYNPVENNYFPKCPFKEMTGYKCPGCGSQRAIHYLLNFNILKAFNENAILVISIPYLIIGFTFEMSKKVTDKHLKWRKILFGRKAIYLILNIIIAFWILRNLKYFF
jgi:hypothetical protein